MTTCQRQISLRNLFWLEVEDFSVLVWECARTAPRTVEPNVKNPPKMRFKKFVKLTGHTCAGNDLTSFEYEDHAKTGNGSYEYADTGTKKLVKSLWGNLFLAGFQPFGTTLRQCAAYLEQNARTQNTGAASVSLLCWEERNAERGTCKAHGSTLVKKLLKPVCQLWFDAKPQIYGFGLVCIMHCLFICPMRP